MEFSLSRDKFSVILTTIIIGFALCGLVIFNFGEFEVDKNTRFAILLSSSAILILCILLFIFRPMKYRIENSNIIICRLLGNKIILKDEIQSVRIPEKKELEWPIRTFGNGGIFGYTGRYYTKHIGSMIWYCSRKNNYIIIERKNKIPVIISPDEYKLFVQSWKG